MTESNNHILSINIWYCSQFMLYLPVIICYPIPSWYLVCYNINYRQHFSIFPHNTYFCTSVKHDSDDAALFRHQQPRIDLHYPSVTDHLNKINQKKTFQLSQYNNAQQPYLHYLVRWKSNLAFRPYNL